MPYRVDFLEEAAQDWLNLDYSVRKRLAQAIERLKTNPRQYGDSLSGPLHGLRRIRTGDYRIVYKVIEETTTVEVGAVCHREDVYRLALKRHLV